MLVQIEDMPLPAELADGIAAPMYQAPNDYHASRDLLLTALRQVRAGEPAATEVLAEAGGVRRSPLPAPVVVAPAYPAPTPGPLVPDQPADAATAEAAPTEVPEDRPRTTAAPSCPVDRRG